jgi:hypothetical protein
VPERGAGGAHKFTHPAKLSAPGFRNINLSAQTKSTLLPLPLFDGPIGIDFLSVMTFADPSFRLISDSELRLDVFLIHLYHDELLYVTTLFTKLKRQKRKEDKLFLGSHGELS